LENADRMRFDINYLNEILGGEDIEIMSANIEDPACDEAFAFDGKKTENAKSAPLQSAFRAELRLYGNN